MVYDILQLAKPGTHYSQLNELRKSLYTKLKCHAISTIEVTHMTCNLQLEIIGHRMSFLAFPYDTPVEFDVKLAGPGMITSNDIPYCLDIGESTVNLFYLNVGEELNFKLSLTEGCGRDHAKFCHFIYLQKPDDSCYIEIRKGVYSENMISSLF